MNKNHADDGKFAKSHGLARTPEYKTWRGMIARCHCPGSGLETYTRYGARGIRVDDSWRGPGGFEAFLAHLGKKPTPHHSIDRIDPDGHYEPGNVRWATWKEQCANKRTSHLITIKGETKPLAIWAQLCGIENNTALGRLKRGWSPEEALLTPPGPRLKTEVRLVTRDGVAASIGEWCRRLGIKRSTVGNRILNGASPEEALDLGPAGQRRKGGVRL